VDNGLRPHRPLTVLSVAYPFARLGPDAVGGAEQVLHTLDAWLTAAGHRSVVIAAEGSAVAGTLVPVPTEAGEITDAVRERTYAAVRAAIRNALHEHAVDLVHLHGIDFPRYLPPGDVPALATLHLPPDWYPGELLRHPPPNLHLHCVSEAERASCPRGAHVLPSVPNGIAVERFGGRHARRGFVLMLGRICEEKGFHLGLEAARRAQVAALLGGEIYRYPEHRRYFDERLRPLLDRRRRFLGPVGFRRKRRLLAAARCVLVPSTAPETSSLVAMEAMASGTPVVCFATGALPEVVEDGRTGLVVKDVDGMAEAIHAAGALRAEACRRVAQERFSAARMGARYLALYRRVLGVGRWTDAA
jgi:glycosyltransferase involved in cell wall biosynthesis